MGSGAFDSINYASSVTSLRGTKAHFAHTAAAHSTGRYTDFTDALDPKKLKKNDEGIGMRESCYDPAFTDLLSIVVALDGTGSMARVPQELQAGLPEIINLLKASGHADHVNVLVELFDDENVVPGAAFQMSQFETAADLLLKATNELIIPGMGGGNDGEAYHLAIYAAANHTLLEGFEREGTKGFFFLIGDEQPYYDDDDFRVKGTTPEVAKEVFGDTLQAEVPMLTSLKKLAERYHVYKIRPGATSHGRNKAVLKRWQELFREAGLNPQNVLEVEETVAVVPTIALTIGKVLGSSEEELIDVLKTTSVPGLDDAIAATKAIVPVESALVKGSIGELATSEEGRERL